MDTLGDWELLSDDGLLDFYGEVPKPVNPSSKSKGVFQFEDYFSPNSQKIAGSSVPTQIVPVPIQFNPTIGKAPRDDEEVTKLPIESSVVPSDEEAIRGLPEAGGEGDAANTQVFFVKMKETDQFVDMKMDSPKSGSKGTMLSQIDAGAYQFEDDVVEGGKMSKTGTEAAEGKEAVGWEEESGGVNIWKWGLSGIGALCSFGMAAATVCIIILGSQQRKQHQQQKHMGGFQIYASDKRIKQVVHQASRLNEVITGRRGGLQLATAHITYGGYYDAL